MIGSQHPLLIYKLDVMADDKAVYIGRVYTYDYQASSLLSHHTSCCKWLGLELVLELDVSFHISRQGTLHFMESKLLRATTVTRTSPLFFKIYASILPSTND